MLKLISLYNRGLVGPVKNFMNRISSIFSALLGLTFSNQAAHSIKVAIVHPIDATGIDYFLIFAKDDQNKYCSISPGYTSCEVQNLTSATMYTIQAKACLSSNDSDVCGDLIENSTWTLPASK